MTVFVLIRDYGGDDGQEVLGVYSNVPAAHAGAHREQSRLGGKPLKTFKSKDGTTYLADKADGIWHYAQSHLLLDD